MWDRKLFIETDASKIAIGGWAFQYDIGDSKLNPKLHAHLIRPIAFVSRNLRPHERRWCLPSGKALGTSCLKGLGLVLLSSLEEERAGSTPAEGTTHL